jgi:hypothetical protein
MILLKSGLNKSREYLGAPLSAHEKGLLSTQSGPRNVVQLVTSCCPAIELTKQVQPTFVISKTLFSHEGLGSPFIFFLLPAPQPLSACDSPADQTLSFSRYLNIFIHSRYPEQPPINVGQPPFLPMALSAFWLFCSPKPL